MNPNKSKDISLYPYKSKLYFIVDRKLDIFTLHLILLNITVETLWMKNICFIK